MDKKDLDKIRDDVLGGNVNMIGPLEVYRRKCRMGEARFVPAKRTALDGRVWWCIFDKKEQRYVPGTRARLRKQIESAIVLDMRHGILPSD